MHEMYNRPVFVPNGDNRRDTAILLIGTAEEAGIDLRSILVNPSGFFITEALADLVYGDGERPAPAESVPAEEDEAVLPYDEWEYKDLKTEVAVRGLTTENQKHDTLVAALVADDEEVSESNTESE